MIDVHSHILPFVDDGSKNMQSSLSMLKTCADAGVTDIILTPHYRGDFKAEKEVLNDNLLKLRAAAKDAGIDVALYLGQEYFIGKDYKKEIKEGKAVLLADSKFLLIELDYNRRSDVTEIVYEIKNMGYEPIVAHIERYGYIDIDTAFEIKDIGGYIQVNADSIVDKRKKQYLKRVKQLLKYDLVDFVAGDLHENRTYYMEQARAYIQKKYGSEREDLLFRRNALKIIK